MHMESGLLTAIDLDPVIKKWGLSGVEKSAKLGLAKAQCNLAEYLSTGIGCEQNGVEELRWRYAAIEQGHVEAYRILGIMFRDGEVPTDHIKAVELFQRGMDVGSIDCICELGLQYQEGRGVTKNAVKAAELFENAIGLGDLVGCYYLENLHAEGDEGIPKDISRAVKYYERGAQADVASAILSLGQCCEGGNENLDDAWALYCLGVKYCIGSGVPQDYAKACEFLERTAQQKDKSAVCLLGYLLDEGLGCSKDPVRAAELYQLGDGDAMLTLGASCEAGGFPVNLVKALDYYRKAVNLNCGLAETYLQLTSGLTTALYEAAQGKKRKAVDHFQAAAQLEHTESVAKLSKMYTDGLWGMDAVSFDTQMRYFTPQTPDTTLSIMPVELLTQIFRWLHPKQCILLRPTSRRILAFFDNDSFARHLLQLNAFFLPSKDEKSEHWFDRMLFHGPHAFQLAYIELRLQGIQVIGFSELKYASEWGLRMKEFSAAFLHWTSLTHLRLRGYSQEAKFQPA
ncbi:hypothetical protein BJ741DRAFT_708761 [Chytriomyces cf. hyalinus JEL632]|nr:hypothetical protein BJ741DRAFT_708761 [Chytriomyces cf. hyalinus JEL632]